MNQYLIFSHWIVFIIYVYYLFLSASCQAKRWFPCFPAGGRGRFSAFYCLFVRRFQAGCVPAVCTIQGKARGHLPRLTPSAQGAVFRPAFYFCLRLQAVSSQKRFAALKKSSPLQGCPVRASGKGEFFQPRGAFFQISFSFSSSGTSCVRSGITRHAPACRSCSPGVLVCTAAQRMPARAAA